MLIEDWVEDGERVCRELLRREPLEIDSARAASLLQGKRVCVTGGGGWIGSALVRAIAKQGPEHITILDASERGLFEIDLGLRECGAEVRHASVRHTSVLGSVCERSFVRRVFEEHRPEIVYHAAACKHVPLMEANPLAAMASNAMGTRVVAEMSLRCGAEQLVMVSTDKAADPLSIMGASKRIAELVLLAMGTGATRMKAVRLGNVFGSQGSVAPLFLRQIAEGGPVTVTHPDARRYFVTLQETVGLLLLALSGEFGTGVLAPKLSGTVRIEELAERMAQAHGWAALAMEFTGLRPGDKMEERLIADGETYLEEGVGDLYGVRSEGVSVEVMDAAMAELERCVREQDVNRMMGVVRRLVPEYRASALLREGLQKAYAEQQA
ncbi:MAG: polysaccharide biosynthesis protein [Acidobacteriaceae bacterium]